MYHLATMYNITDRQTDRQTETTLSGHCMQYDRQSSLKNHINHMVSEWVKF